MTLQKNVGSQKVVFLMVDATDFATPETGMSVTGYYYKDGGGKSTCSNTVSEITSGLYVLTLAQTETNGDVVAYQFTATGCADQFLVFYPEDGYDGKITSILADTNAILTDTGTTLENRTVSIVDQVSQILADTGTTLENRTTSIVDQVSQILADTGTTLENRQTSILDKVGSILTDTGTTLDDKIDSILVDTKTTLDGKIDSILADTNTISNIPTDDVSGAIASILVDTGTTLDDKIDSILVDTGTTLENRTTSIVDIVSDIESNLSNAISTLDGPILSTLDKIDTVNVVTCGVDPTTLAGKVQSIYNYLFKKKTVTSALETAYEKDNTSTMETWTLADDGTTASKTP